MCVHVSRLILNACDLSMLVPTCLLIANYYRNGKSKFMFSNNLAIILILPTALDRPYCMVENAVTALALVVAAVSAVLFCLTATDLAVVGCALCEALTVGESNQHIYCEHQ